MRFHIDLIEDRGSFKSDAIAQTVEGKLVSTVGRYDGTHDLAIIDVASDNAEYLREILNEDENVAGYREYA